MTFQVAGSDDDLRAAYQERQVDARLQRGQELLGGALALMRRRPSREGREHAQRAAREALASFASALDWAEDTDREDEAHQQLDDAGAWVRRTFGCHLHLEKGTYSQRCPVALGHNRIGMSIGGAAKRICSLCGEDLSECEHRRGTAYLVPGGSTDLGWCRVCLKESECDHDASNEYRAGVVSMIVEMALIEVSIVSKPANPEARFTSVDVDLVELHEHLGLKFVPGMPVNCDRCISPCGGLTRHGADHL